MYLQKLHCTAQHTWDPGLFFQLTWLFCHGVRTVVCGRAILGETISYLKSLVHGDGGRPSK